ncbi:hypothetical protein Psuf_036400 [Phytohabitans suffuscus]|uniref:Uncharacterized protein n=1 Tax=Phytohabitans suffuscus TaxID=624315 RepID=A0A6F8YJS3_9ACTN|nr:hypothetical protein Psuf_036400 [Phytohabitans suffuscus]
MPPARRPRGQMPRGQMPRGGDGRCRGAKQREGRDGYGGGSDHAATIPFEGKFRQTQM